MCPLVVLDCPGHEVLYIAAADNIGGRDLAAAVKAQSLLLSIECASSLLSSVCVCLHVPVCVPMAVFVLRTFMPGSRYGDAIELKELARPDASGISCAKAKRLIGWEPTRTWRDYLDEEGRAKPIEEQTPAL